MANERLTIRDLLLIARQRIADDLLPPGAGIVVALPADTIAKGQVSVMTYHQALSLLFEAASTDTTAAVIYREHGGTGKELRAARLAVVDRVLDRLAREERSLN